MYYTVTDVQPQENHTLLLTFDGKEQKIFDVSPYLEWGRFSELKDPKKFKNVRVCFDTIEWDKDLDLDPLFLYQESKAQ